MKPVLVSSGEPAGIGPDICLSLIDVKKPVVILGDINLLQERAKQLNLKIKFAEYKSGVDKDKNVLTVLSINCPEKVIPGKLNAKNSSYVIKLLEEAAKRCLTKEFSALVTAPVQKSIINEAGYSFIGHTEFFADFCKVKKTVMMLASKKMRVALVTTHLPLKNVAQSISKDLIIEIIIKLNHSLKNDFNIRYPKIFVAGLNPHAGENGYLGDEELKIIKPAIQNLQQQNINVTGPYSADTMFTPANNKICDAYVAMYHDQGLAVLKYASFGNAVNITLGLTFIRTSVDHGTALELAGTGKADASSLHEAVKQAALIFSTSSRVRGARSSTSSRARVTRGRGISNKS